LNGTSIIRSGIFNNNKKSPNLTLEFDSFFIYFDSNQSPNNYTNISLGGTKSTLVANLYLFLLQNGGSNTRFIACLATSFSQIFFHCTKPMLLVYQNVSFGTMIVTSPSSRCLVNLSTNHGDTNVK
jgi:hypothetical protein